MLFLVLISAGSFLVPDRDFSANENRYLAEKPVLSLNNILDCEFQDGLEEYLNDQIWGRDAWITIMSNQNIIAVATLADTACIILAEDVQPDDGVAALAEQKGINLLCSSEGAYETAIRLRDCL